MIVTIGGVEFTGKAAVLALIARRSRGCGVADSGHSRGPVWVRV